ncbi:MAG: hypothetical protein PF437_02285 [Sulfurimonas sp.]|jgi:hypothetical protein|nr:hypothetical protein [Sulfurimonas sp.]
MRYLAWFGGLFATLIIGLYVIAFTSFGNSILQPVIEEKIKEQTLLDSKLSVFSLSMSELHIEIKIDKDNIVGLKGNYSLFSQSFDINYKVKFDDLNSLKSLSGVELHKAFHTNGKVKGNMAFINIDGISDVASSDTTYHVELTEFNPTSIIAKVKNLKLVELLEIGAQKPYASADVNLDINFKNIKPHALDGNIVLKTEDGKLNTKVMKNDFNIIVPSTDFAMSMDAQLKGDDVDYAYKLMSNLFKITSSGKVIPTPLKTDVKYAIDIKELALLKPVTGADVRGSFRLNGRVKGTKDKLTVDGESDVASSDTKFEAILKDFAPSSVVASMKNLKLSRVLYMVKQPHYADGIFSLDVNIADARSAKLNGTVVTSVKKGLLDVKYMTKAYKFKTPMPQTAFQMTTSTTLNGNIIDTKVNLDSTLANFDIKRARINLSNNSVVSDYKATVPNLDKLFFATEQHLKGDISVHGELNKGNDLDLTILSNVAGGKIDAKLHNDDFHADILSIQTLDALHMLIYPEIFKSSLNAKLDYNLAHKKGKFDGHLVDGKFTKNEMFSLIKQYAKVDMYVETFKGDVNADINKEKIVASMNLKSNTSSIKTKNTRLNTKTKTIDSKIDVVANKNPVLVTLKGKTSSPKVSVDVEDLLKQEAGKAIEKEVGKLLKGFF